MTEAGQKKRRRRHQVKEVEQAISFKDVSLKDVDEDNYMEDNKDAKEHSEDWDDNDGEGKGSRFSLQGQGEPLKNELILARQTGNFVERSKCK